MLGFLILCGALGGGILFPLGAMCFGDRFVSEPSPAWLPPVAPARRCPLCGEPFPADAGLNDDCPSCGER
jgi:hypothetical protein